MRSAPVQRIADRFATCYLPVVVAIAVVTFAVSGNPLATAAVLMVACSCSFAIATPVAMIASIGASARRGLLIKGSKHVETLARADVVLLDKTGTLTLGKPAITDVVALDEAFDSDGLLQLAATAERSSDHPLAAAVREAAAARALHVGDPEEFQAIPGQGVRMRAADGAVISVGSRRTLLEDAIPAIAAEFEAQGKTLLCVTRNDSVIGLLAARDIMRAEVPAALAELMTLGIARVELLTGDNERTAAALAGTPGIAYRANLLPEDKIAIEAAHIALMGEDWRLIPEVFRIARRTMGVVRLNLGFTMVYNLTGLVLAAFGLPPPVFAAAAQSGPDFGILANSARLLNQTERDRAVASSEAAKRAPRAPMGFAGAPRHRAPERSVVGNRVPSDAGDRRSSVSSSGAHRTGAAGTNIQ